MGKRVRTTRLAAILCSACAAIFPFSPLIIAQTRVKSSEGFQSSFLKCSANDNQLAARHLQNPPFADFRNSAGESSTLPRWAGGIHFTCFLNRRNIKLDHLCHSILQYVFSTTSKKGNTDAKVVK
jgi:hypothetical protein